MFSFDSSTNIGSALLISWDGHVARWHRFDVSSEPLHGSSLLIEEVNRWTSLCFLSAGIQWAHRRFRSPDLRRQSRGQEVLSILQDESSSLSSIEDRIVAAENHLLFALSTFNRCSIVDTFYRSMHSSLSSRNLVRISTIITHWKSSTNDKHCRIMWWHRYRWLVFSFDLRTARKRIIPLVVFGCSSTISLQHHFVHQWEWIYRR